jgi:hypothetical protein
LPEICRISANLNTITKEADNEEFWLVNLLDHLAPNTPPSILIIRRDTLGCNYFKSTTSAYLVSWTYSYSCLFLFSLKLCAFRSCFFGDRYRMAGRICEFAGAPNEAQLHNIRLANGNFTNNNSSWNPKWNHLCYIYIYITYSIY